jgi:tetratricopeptide (TPR) repeat protein
LSATMIAKLEAARKGLVGRDDLLQDIEQLRRNIAKTEHVGLKHDLYQRILRVADDVHSMEVAAFGSKSHAQIADTLQLLSTIALEQNKHADAIDYLQQAITISKDCLGVKHPRTGQYYLRLARIHLSHDNETLALLASLVRRSTMSPSFSCAARPLTMPRPICSKHCTITTALCNCQAKVHRTIPNNVGNPPTRSKS